MLTPIDQIASQNHLQLLKAVVSYLPVSQQKFAAVFLKAMEMQNLLHYFQTSSSGIRACSSSFGQAGLYDMITDLKQYCEGRDQELLDQWSQILSMIELYSMFAGNIDPEQLISNIMSPTDSPFKEPIHEPESMDK